jgi:hypothetical protein
MAWVVDEGTSQRNPKSSERLYAARLAVARLRLAAVAAPAVTISESSTVYVAHDDRYPTKPSWMSGFTDTGQNLVSGAGTFSVYARNYAAGAVTLGANASDTSSERSMYSVAIKPESGGTGSGGASGTGGSEGGT